MRLTRVLFAQHSDYWFRRKWIQQGRRLIKEVGPRRALERRGITVHDAVEYANYKHPLPPFELERNPIPKKEVFDETHPLWNERICHTFKDDNVLLEGIPQAQVITKSIVIKGLPSNLEESIENIKLPTNTHEFMQHIIRTSHLLDAEQQKLPKRKVPDRPAFNLPRDYGITDFRKNRLFIAKIFQECEKLAGKSVTSIRKVLNDMLFVVSFEKDGDLIQNEIEVETFLMSKKPIAPTDIPTEFGSCELPDLFPLKYTISMPKENIYQLRDVYPIANGSPYNHPHTIILHLSFNDVKNLHATPVTDTQSQSRSLLKAFTVAASKARALYGSDVGDLREPIVVQSIQVNGSYVHFGLFQLNTLNLNGNEGTKNVWYNGPELQLYKECLYKLGRPILSDYNPDVLRYFYGFYKNN